MLVMKTNAVSASIFAILALSLTTISGEVLQHHLNETRDGAYVDPLMTRKAAAAIHLDRAFNAPVQGPVYAQPLYVDNGPGGKAALVVATERNTVLALDAATGAQIWTKTLGNPVQRSQLPCGNIDPLGITGTPIIDPNDRTIYVAAMTTPDGGRTKQQLVFALSLDDGSARPGWPVSVSGMKYGGFSFNSSVQNQRGALLLNSGVLYVPYGGHWGDCGDYHGWVIAVPLADPKSPTAWSTEGRGGGAWAPGGIATDGRSVFVATGNTFGARTWMGGEAIIRLGSGAKFSGNSTDYFTPSNWRHLDDDDADLGGSGPVLFDVPGATPSKLIIALGKNGVAYLLNRDDLGGIGKGNGIRGEGVQSNKVSSGEIINAAATYRTASASYVVFETRGSGIGCPGRAGKLVALRIGASSPPSMTIAWCANNMGGGSPIATTIDGKSEPIVWTVGTGSSNRLHAFDGDTGEVLFAGGGQEEQMSRVQNFQTPAVVNGRIFVAANDRIFAFTSR
jgi:PQQ-like domain